MIGTSPINSPGLRSPTMRGIPSTSLTTSMALEQGEERTAIALVRRVVAGGEADVRRRAREALPAFGAQGGEVGNPLDFLRGDHSGVDATSAT